MDINTPQTEYYKVSYWIDTPSYDHRNGNLGFDSESERAAFYANCRRIFEAGGWHVEDGYARNGKSELHLHPQMFLGIVHTDLIDTVPGLIEHAALFRPRGNEIHILNPIYDITREQQREYLASRRTEIENDLLETFRTVRCNLYRVPNDLWFDIHSPRGRKYGLPVFDDDDVNHEAANYISEVFSALVADGRIVQKEIRGNPGYRTFLQNKTPKKRKKTVSSSETPNVL